MNQEDTGFHSLVRVLWRHRLVAIGTLLAIVAIVAVLDLLIRSPLYRSDAEILIANRAGSLISDQPADLDRAMRNELEIADSRSVTAAVEQRFGPDPEVKVAIVDGQDVMTITAVDALPERAAAMALFYADVYLSVRQEVIVEDYRGASEAVQTQIDRLNELIDRTDGPSPTLAEQQEIDLLIAERSRLNQQLNSLTLNSDLSEVGSARLISHPVADPEPVSPRLARDLVLASALGIVLGISAAYATEIIRQLRTQSDDAMAAAVAPLPILAELPSTKKPPSLAILTNVEPVYSESIRRLETAIGFLGHSKQHTVVQLLSTIPNEGKTTVAANLGLALAERGHEVVVVDGDLRNPSLTALFGIDPEEPGFADLIVDEEMPGEFPLFGDPDVKNFSILPAGDARAEAIVRLGTDRTKALLKHLRSQFDFVIVDSTPVLAVADSSILAGMTDMAIIVAKPDTDIGDVKKAITQLRQLDVEPAGVVLNQRSDPTQEPSYGYGAHNGAPTAYSGSFVRAG